MFCAEEAVQVSDRFEYPVYETAFSPNEIEELLSLFDSTGPVSPNSGSEGSSRAVYSRDERMQRRKISNRESARRSRWRKKRQFEDLTDEVNRLTAENQEMKNLLGSVINQCHLLCRENEQIMSESVALSGRLSDLWCILSPMQSHNSNVIKLNNMK